MKKRFLSIILAVFVVLSAISLPTFAYSNVCEEIDFNGFVSGDLTSVKSKYGTMSAYDSPYPGGYYSFTPGPDRNSEDGNSFRMYMLGASNATNNDKFFGATYTSEHTYTGKVRIEASVMHTVNDDTSDSEKIPPSGLHAVFGEREVMLVYFDNIGRIELWNGSALKLYNGTNDPTVQREIWYDITIDYDLDNNDIIYNIWADGVKIFDNVRFDGAVDETIKSGLTKLTYRYRWNFKSIRTKLSESYDHSPVVCLDNIKIKNIDAMSGSEKPYIADYEDFTASSVQWHFPAIPAGAEYTNKQNVGGGTVDGFMSAQAGRGNSLKIVTGTTTATNANLQFIPTQATPDAVSGKMALQVPDKAFHKIAYIKTSGGDQINAVLFSSGGNLSIFGQSICTYKFDHWYDIEYSYSAVDGSYFYKVYDGETEYIGNGIYTQSKGYPQTVSQMAIQLNNQKTKIDSHIIVDDLVFKAIDDEFKLDVDLSANNKTIASNETVYARFTKELDETPETLASKVFEYYDNAEITSVSLIDKYTVKVEFAKEMGKTYRVDFKNIAATDGSVTSGYIVFDVKKEDLYLSDSIFKTESGEIPSLLKPGKITSSIDAYANNGKSFSYIYALGLFCDNELTALDCDVINIGEEKQTYTRTVTVPSDGSYVLKAFVWDAVTLEPIRRVQTLKPTPDNKPVAIVKLDDLRADNDAYLNVFTDMASWAGDNGIRISTGLIAESLETTNATDERIAKVKALADNKNVEVWFHGYANANTFAGDDNEEAQREDFQKGIAAAAKHGITFKSFGPPSNNMRPITAELIENEFTNFTTVMALSTSGQAYSSYLDRCNDLFSYITVEAGATGKTDTLDNLKALWNEKSTRKYILLQAHPAQWADHEGGEERFKEFLLWLKSEGVVFMTPSEYTAYLNALN